MKVMENQIFSLPRFGAYLKKYFAEFRNLALQFVIITGLLTFFMFISGGELSFFTSTVVLFVYAVSTASRMSALFVRRTSKIDFLLVPASQFEKLLAIVVHLYIYLPLMFIVSSLVAQYCTSLLTAMFALSLPHFELPFAAVEIESDLLLPFFMSYINVVAFYLMGATIFTKHSFLKTTGMGLAVGLLFSIVSSVGVAMHLFSVSMMQDFENFDLVMDKGTIFLIVANVVVTLLFLGITYLRITEMEANETKK